MITADSSEAISVPVTKFGMSPSRIFATTPVRQIRPNVESRVDRHARHDVDKPVRVSVLLFLLLLPLSGHEDVHGILDRALLADERPPQGLLPREGLEGNPQVDRRGQSCTAIRNPEKQKAGSLPAPAAVLSLLREPRRSVGLSLMPARRRCPALAPSAHRR